MANESDQRTSGFRQPEVIMKETLDRIKREAARLEARGRNYHWKHAAFTFITIVLGVTAPALVTYAQGSQIPLFQGSGGGDWAISWPLIAILATALVAAAANLKTAFRWGDRFGLAALAALELDELSSSTEFDFERVLRVTKEQELYGELQRVNKEALMKMHSITRRYLESERAVASQAALSKNEAQAQLPEGNRSERLPA